MLFYFVPKIKFSLYELYFIFLPSATNNAREVPVRLVRNRSIDDFNDQMVHMLDEIERRVEQLRYGNIIIIPSTW